MTQYFNHLRKKLSIPEINGKRIGLFRTIMAIFGGLILSSLSMTLLLFLIPGRTGETIIIPVILNTFIWAALALWISISVTKWIALLRTIIPSIFLSLLLIILYNL